MARLRTAMENASVEDDIQYDDDGNELDDDESDVYGGLDAGMDDSVNGGGSGTGGTVLSSPDREMLKTILKQWVVNDNTSRALSAELAKKRKVNKELTQRLLEVIKRLDIETVDINNGYISYVKKTQQKGLSKKLLNEIFTKYYRGNIDEVQRMTNFINDNREVTVKETIVRKII
jgi:hypothetical protein